MIYVLISAGEANKKTEQIKKRDCRLVRQPLSLLPKEIKEYIENTKNEELRLERGLAYTSLFCGLKEFYGIENANVKRTKDGKPYLTLPGEDTVDSKCQILGSKKQYQKNEDFDVLVRDDSVEKKGYSETDCMFLSSPSLPCTDDTSSIIKKIFIGISHSEGVSAVCLSDEGEVGIDIQVEIDIRRAEKLNERFFPDAMPLHTNLGVRYYFCNISEKQAYIEPADPDCADLNSETVKWTYCESLLKLSGGGFRDLKMTGINAKGTETELKNFEYSSKFTLAISRVK